MFKLSNTIQDSSIYRIECLPHTLIFSALYLWSQMLQTLDISNHMYSVRSNNLSLKYQRFKILILRFKYLILFQRLNSFPIEFKVEMSQMLRLRFNYVNTIKRTGYCFSFLFKQKFQQQKNYQRFLFLFGRFFWYGWDNILLGQIEFI